MIGLATAIALITMAVTGFLMWRRRKPDSVLGAPPVPANPARLRVVAVTTLLLAALLPLLAASMLLVWLLEKLALRFPPGAAAWLGLRSSAAAV